MRTIISVFKTSVTSEEEANKVRPYLDLLYAVKNWNFDLEDCDNILRVDSITHVSEYVVRMMIMLGFSCEELE